MCLLRVLSPYNPDETRAVSSMLIGGEDPKSIFPRESGSLCLSKGVWVYLSFPKSVRIRLNYRLTDGLPLQQSIQRRVSQMIRTRTSAYKAIQPKQLYTFQLRNCCFGFIFGQESQEY